MSHDETYTTRVHTDVLERELNKLMRIELFFQGKQISVGHSDLPFCMGRDQSGCALVVSGETISRQHCVLQVRDRQIGLLDTSTNGTYVRVGRADSVFVHNDFYPLVGQGAIKLGQPIEADEAGLILYKVLIAGR